MKKNGFSSYKEFCEFLAETIIGLRKHCEDMTPEEFERFAKERRDEAEDMGIHPYIVETILEQIEPQS